MKQDTLSIGIDFGGTTVKTAVVAGREIIDHAPPIATQDFAGHRELILEMVRAVEGIKKLKARAAACGVSGGREYNPGWHTAIDLNNLLTVSEAVTLAAIQRKESRGAQFREDFPEKSADYAKFNHVISKAGDGSMQVWRQPVAALRPDLAAVVEENK